MCSSLSLAESCISKEILELRFAYKIVKIIGFSNLENSSSNGQLMNILLSKLLINFTFCLEVDMGHFHTNSEIEQYHRGDG